MKQVNVFVLLCSILCTVFHSFAYAQRAQAGWSNSDVRHTVGQTVAIESGTLQLTAWRGEHLTAQIGIHATEQLEQVCVTAQPLVKGRDSIGSGNIRPTFVDNVMTDGLKADGSGGCGYRNSSDYDSSMVADIIGTDMLPITLTAGEVRLCWLTIDVPAEAKAGQYKGHVTVSCAEGELARLALSVKVVNRLLPPAAEWAFHLDLWQNPYAVARYYNVEAFTQEHFDRLRPIMRHYAEAGGKVITTSITHKPWNGQTYDPFESMVTWVRRSDGTWLYDYTLFDSWVEFMMELGVRDQISCYSMVPWRLSFQYFDMASNSMRFISCRPGEDAYEDFWGTMLRDFARHLRQRGWFERTYIAMDERSLPDMLATLKVIRQADPEFRISLAGSYHDELAGELDDYCITLGEQFPDSVLESRRERGMVSTFYTCCQEREPNTFTFSAPAEAEWLAWHAAAVGLDGYLRWALNSWVRDPLHDSRFTAWPAGDTYLLYPDGKTSIRMERLRQGIQQYEKIRLLRQQLPPAGRRKLEKALQPFADFYAQPPAEAIQQARQIINSL